MGYNTYFTGSLKTDKSVTDEFMDYINDFSAIRHMKRDINKIKEIYPYWKVLCFNGDLGVDGQYFIGVNEDSSVIDHNTPADGVPGLWCQWVMEDNNSLEWDCNEKFYNYTEWLEYLIKHFFEPSGYVLNGEIEFQGEDEEDFGIIKVTDNNVCVSYGMRIMDLGSINVDVLIAELKRRGYTI